MVETLYGFAESIIIYFSQVVDLLSSVQVFGYSALDVVFGLGIGAYFAYVALQWVIPE